VTGRVVIVGAGPGAADLITVRGRDRLLVADLVIADRLGTAQLLAQLGPEVEVVDAGRTRAGRAISQDEINATMIEAARAGRTVVRLKGGDPFVLAHGLEEVTACAEAGVAVEVVPGVSSATSAPALAGIALTRRDGAQGFTVLSGHLPPGHPDSRLDWGSLARSGATLVLLMAVRTIAAISARLVLEGVDPSSPSFAVADASLAGQRLVQAPLAELAAAMDAAALANPAVIVVQPRPAAHTRILVLGGSRSGKSGFAESLLAGEPVVDYLATAARRDDDAEWTERIRQHQVRRPAHWRTVEATGTTAASALRQAGAPVLLDSITAWLTSIMDESGFWQGNPIDARLLELELAWAGAGHRVVAVSDEVGSGVVPASASGRSFRDALGTLNQRLAGTADEVWLVTAGIARRLK
jgi:uroporphyrin-III C-methyltransferase